MEILARVNPRYFAAINLFQANNDIRYYLNGVYIDPHPQGGVVIVATNGHFLAAVHDPDGYAARPIIVGDITKQLITACKSKGQKIAKGIRSASYLAPTALYIGQSGAVVGNGEARVGDVDPFAEDSIHMSKISIVDAVFPDYARVIPRNENREARIPDVNARYLAVFAQATEIMVGSNKYEWAIRLFSTGETTSIIARISHIELKDRFVGVVMPLRGDGTTWDSIAPSWLPPKEEPKTDLATA